MKKLLMTLDNLATAKLEALTDYIIIRFKLEEKDKPSAYKIEQKFYSTYPKNRPSLQDWCKEVRFGMLHNRHAVYMN